MAWKFVSVNDVEARAKRQLVLDQITRFWAALAEKLPAIEQDLNGHGNAADAAPPENVARMMQLASPELIAWMNEQVGDVDPRLTWEFGNDISGGRYLVLSPREHLQLRPMTQSLLARAPQLPGWKFYGYRPPLAHLEAADAVKLRTGHTVVAPTALARIGSQNRIDMIFKLKIARTDPAGALVVAAALAEAVLGEHASDRWVGELEAEELSRGPVPDQYLGMSQLRQTVAGLVQTMTNHLPSKPYHQQSKPTRWHTLKFTPTPGTDYARQDDLAIGRTIIPKIRAAALGDGPDKSPKFPFYSANFSRHGEIFCYLKIDMPDVSMEKRRQRKYDYEDKIDPALRNAGVGCVVGSSTGQRYLYFDLAITDLNKAMQVMGPVLLAKELPERSWLLFYDTELSDEYVGLRSGAGAPPEARPFQFARRVISRPPAPAASAPQAAHAETPSESELFPDDLLL